MLQISTAVGTKSKKACIRRFKYLVQMVRNKKEEGSCWHPFVLLPTSVVYRSFQFFPVDLTNVRPARDVLFGRRLRPPTWLFLWRRSPVIHLATALEAFYTCSRPGSSIAVSVLSNAWRRILALGFLFYDSPFTPWGDPQSDRIVCALRSDSRWLAHESALMLVIHLINCSIIVTFR